MLYNCKDPIETDSSLRLQMLEQDVYEHFEASLCGGYRSCHVLKIIKKALSQDPTA
jgi:hypothetical protein